MSTNELVDEPHLDEPHQARDTVAMEPCSGTSDTPPRSLTSLVLAPSIY